MIYELKASGIDEVAWLERSLRNSMRGVVCGVVVHLSFIIGGWGKGAWHAVVVHSGNAIHTVEL